MISLFLVRLIGLGRSLEAIADTVDGVEPLGLLGIIAQLGAKVLHVAIDGALIALKVVPKHLLDQLHTVVDTAGMTSKRGEQLELGSRQIDFLAFDQDLVARDIDDQIAEVEYLDGGLVGLVGTTEQGAYAGDSSRGENGLIR